jgi:hypothetical protein
VLTDQPKVAIARLRQRLLQDRQALRRNFSQRDDPPLELGQG